jgi:hypothetical protein
MTCPFAPSPARIPAHENPEHRVRPPIRRIERERDDVGQVRIDPQRVLDLDDWSSVLPRHEDPTRIVCSHTPVAFARRRVGRSLRNFSVH